MTLIDRAIALKARAMKIHTKIGNPKYRDVVIRLKEQVELPNGMITETNTDVLIKPTPKVVNVVDKEEDSMGNSIYIESTNYNNSNDYKVTVSRVNDIPNTDNINYLILDPIFDEDNKVVGGLKCNLVYISDGKMLDWEIIIQRVTDSGYTINPLNSVVMNDE